MIIGLKAQLPLRTQFFTRAASSIPAAALAEIVNLKINFQPTTVAVPSGYVVDSGAAYGVRGNGQSYGWSAGISANTRDRNAANSPDQRYDTLIATQLGGVERTWELGVANGTYQVRVVAGDASYFDSTYRVAVEGVLTVNGVPTSGNRWIEGTQTVSVTDGKLTVTNAAGAINNKLCFVEVASVDASDTTPPAAPSSVTATANNNRVTLGWNPNTEPDLAGYNVFRGLEAGVSTTGTPLNGSTLLSSTIYVDQEVTNGVTYHYVVQSVDLSGNKADSSPPVSVTPNADATPPNAPTQVAASANSNQVTLTWNANTEPDLAGYNVYRNTNSTVSTTGTPLNGNTLLTSNDYLDTFVANGVTYFYVVEAVDTSGNKTASSPAVSATPQEGDLDIRINFQPASGSVPVGYMADTGAAYSAGRGYGWVKESSLEATTPEPLDITPNTRRRNLQADVRLDTFVHMQFPASAVNQTAIKEAAAWEMAVANGAYDVTVGVGDAGAFYDSVHRLNVEGQVAVADFVPSAGERHRVARLTVNVADGKLTLDAIGGSNTKLDFVTVITANAPANNPRVTNTNPANNAVNVSRDAFVSAEVFLPNVGQAIDNGTLTAATVKLVRTSDNRQIPANLNTSGGGDVIVLQPTVLLESNTSYTFRVTSGLKDLSGASFTPYISSFTTGASGGGVSHAISFEKVSLPNATGKPFTGVTIGPDGKVYAGTISGEILRFTILPDGTLDTPQTITTVRNNGSRFLVGMAFDPSSTADNLILWVSHNAFAFNNAPEWTGKISRLSGANLETLQDYVVGLPRSIRDHLTNSIAFGPDGMLYFTQGSNSAMGAADAAWGERPERLLNAAVLRFRPSDITAAPLNVKTSDGGGTYNPFAVGAPLTIYASGIRNAYDLVWHSNGQLYVPTNGSAAGGNTPGTPSPLPPDCQRRIDGSTNGDYTTPPVGSLTNVTAAQDDYLFRVIQNGYYGHPNSQRCEWVMNGGNPTTGVDPAEVEQYETGTLPDRNYRGFAFSFGEHYSPNGVIEYKNDAFGGALRGKLLVVRYSGGDDIIALTPGGAQLDIVNSETGITGFTGFIDPLDLTENPQTGFLYVAEYGGQRLTLLRPVVADTIPPSPPANVTANAGDKQVSLQWNANTETDLAGYNIYRNGSSLPLNANLLAATNYTDMGLVSGTTYTYVIEAVDRSNNRAAAAPVSATPFDNVPPAAPSNVATTNGNRQVTVSWSANTEADIAGYNIYRDGATTPLNGTLINTTNYTDMGLTNGTTYSYTVEAVDTSGNKTAAAAVNGTPVEILLQAKINFQPSTGGVPADYTPDTGAAYSTTRGFGWVREDSLGNASATPLSVSTYARRRNLNPDARLDTLMSMQISGTPAAAWEYALPGGTYTVTVAVGDAQYTDSRHRINVEGVTAINNFIPGGANGSSSRHQTVTVTVPVSDGKLTIHAVGGLNTKINYLDIQDVRFDKTAPAVETQITGEQQSGGTYRNKATIKINASDSGGSGLASTEYSINNGAFQPYTAPFDITTPGSYTVVARATDGAGNRTTTTAQSFSVVAVAVARSNAEIELQNLDVVPYPDRLVFSRIENPETGTTLKPDGTCCIPPNGVHDQATVRVKNTGIDSLKISALAVTGQWIITPTVALPATIAPNGFLDVRLKFIATNNGTENGIHRGSLTISSDDADEPETIVQLAGFWQSVSEGSQEPTLEEIAKVFGYSTVITGSGQSVNTQGSLQAVGEEVLSPYWTRVNPNKPVVVRQLVAYHRQGAAAFIHWHAKGNNTLTQLFVHQNSDGQTILPRLHNGNGALASGSFSPTTVFGFNIDGYEWSDPTKNKQSDDQANGCTGQCGHHLRFWAARDRNGFIIPNTWLMGMDYSGINYDYQDNLYLITNMSPENPAANPSAAAAIPGAPSLNLDFNTTYAGTLADKDGETTGFTITQPNKLDTTLGGNSYQATRLDINTAGSGTLAVQSTAGSHDGTDNTQANLLQKFFDASVGSFAVGTRLLGALDTVNASGQQGGVTFGANQDNFAKFTVTARNGAPALEFYAEQNGSGVTVGGANSVINLTQPETIQSLDLYLIGNPRTGVVRAAYRIVRSGGDTGIITLPDVLTLSDVQIGNFFSTHAKGGILTSHKSATELTFTFDRFAVTVGDPTAAPPSSRNALYRLDVAGAGNYTDTAGNTWTPDNGFFTPSTAIAEGATVEPQEIANTDDDSLYRTYRGNVGSVPLNQRVLTYNLPITRKQKVDLRLHFAERFSGNNTAGKRVFDIEAEGKTVRDDFDIFAASGGLNTAVVLPINDVEVSDCNLNLTFRTEVDFASIAAIEVLCQGDCNAGTNSPPSVSLTAPSEGDSFVDPAAITLKADALDADGCIGKIDFYSGTTLIGTDTSSPFSVVWNNVTEGNYSVTAVATDTEGATAVSSAVNVSVRGGTKINFQPASAAIPSGYLVDGGAVYGSRGNGQTYGWNISNSGNVRDRNAANSPDQRYDTLAPMQTGGSNFAWEIAVANGTYRVRVVAGDASFFDSTYKVAVEGVLTVNGVPTSGNRWIEGTQTVSVTDGKLTVTNAAGAINNKLCFVEISSANSTAGNPSVQITSPADDTSFIAPPNITIAADATDVDGQVSHVDFFAGTTFIGSDSTSPYAVTWNSPPSGNYTLTARAFDNTGAATTSTPVSIKVNNAPSVSITSPTNNTVFAESSNITISATAADSDGSISRVEFFREPADNHHNDPPTSLGVDTTSPYSVIWSNAPAGEYVVKAVATDNGGANVTSTPVIINVNAFNGARINFQPASAAIPSGYLVDGGAVYGSRGNGQTYGWNVSNAGNTRDRNSTNAADQRYDTLAGMQVNGGNPFWELSVPNGTYRVRVVAGDALYFNAVYKINVEGVLVVNGTPVSTNRWIEGTQNVTVSDGRLTITNAPEAVNNAICFVEVLPPSSNTPVSWTTVAPQPFANSEGQGVVVGGKLYSFGGFDSTKTTFTPTRRAYVYDPTADTWTAIRDLPKGVTHGGFTTDGTDIFYAGGYIENATRDGQIFGTREVWRYNVGSDSYTALPPLPIERSGGQLVLLGRNLHYFGGTNLERTLDVGDHYVLNLDTGTTWTSAASLPNPRHHLGAAALGGKIYAVGGQHKHDGNLVTQSSVHVYDPVTNAWTEVAALPRPRGHIAAATVVRNNRIIVMGGESGHQSHLVDVNEYNPATNTWTSLTGLPVPRSSGVGASIDGVLYYSTGSRSTTTYKGVIQ